MKSIIAKLGAAKLLAGAAAVVVIGGGAYAVKTLTHKGNSTNYRVDTNASSSSKAAAGVARAVDRNAHQASSLFVSDNTKAPVNNPVRPRIDQAARIALLTKDLISTNPAVIVNPGETTGTVHLDLQVINESGMPVPNAHVKVAEYAFNAGTYLANVTRAESDIKAASTNANGIARVSVPAGPQLTNDSEFQAFKTSRLTAIATHPDYTPTRAVMDFTSITRMVMTSGNILEVLPIDSTTSAPIKGGVESEFSSHIQPEQYARDDGTIIFRKIADEEVSFILKHYDDQGNLLVSDLQTVTLPANTAAPVQVALHPTLTVIGKLGDSIPRPVKDVEIYTIYYLASSLGKTTSTITVSPDGNFTISNIPKGTNIDIAALGKEYCSVTRSATAGHAYPHEIIVNQDGQPLTLHMEKTADVVLTVIDPDGNPVVGGNVSATVTLWNMGDSPRWGGPYSAVTDEHGMARIENVPPLKKVRFQMKHPELSFPSIDSQTTKYWNGKVGKTHNYNIALDLSGGGNFSRTVKAEVKPPEAPTPGSKIMFVLQDGETLTYHTLLSPDDKP